MHNLSLLKYIISKHSTISTEIDHQIILSVHLSSSYFSKGLKKTSSKKKNKKNDLTLLINKAQSKNLFFPHIPGSPVNIFTMENISNYLVDSKRKSESEALSQIINDVENKKLFLDYIILDRSELSIIKPFSRKLNKLGLLPTIQNGTLVESKEKVLVMKKELEQLKSKKVRFYSSNFQIIIGNTSMDCVQMKANMNASLDWINSLLDKKDISHFILESFNSQIKIDGKEIEDDLLST
tara:strand:+ start:6100 stop:6813 length:714 start_codon:yes stop_codon:yes gene_type:complete